MYCNEKLKLNKFKLVRIPKPAEYFARFGYNGINESMYSGDENTPLYMTKIDNCRQGVEDYQSYCESASNEAD